MLGGCAKIIVTNGKGGGGGEAHFFSRIADFKIAAGGHSFGSLNLVSLPGFTFRTLSVYFYKLLYKY